MEGIIGVMPMSVRQSFDNFITQKLISLGFKTTNIPQDTSEKLILFSRTHRRQEYCKRPRTIHIARNFVCPDAYRTRFNSVIRVLKTGGTDIVNYLSTGILTNDRDDAMLNHDGIYHFHLIPPPRRNDDIGNKMVFAYLDENDAYILGIYTHEDFVFSFDKLRTMYSNWPELFSSRESNSETGLTETMVRNVRSKNGNIMEYLLDNMWVSFRKFSGTVGRGDNVLDIMYADQVMNRINCLESQAQRTFGVEEITMEFDCFERFL